VHDLFALLRTHPVGAAIAVIGGAWTVAVLIVDAYHVIEFSSAFPPQALEGIGLAIFFIATLSVVSRGVRVPPTNNPAPSPIVPQNNLMVNISSPQQKTSAKNPVLNEMRALYKGHTYVQGDHLFALQKGRIIEITGKVKQVSNYTDSSATIWFEEDFPLSTTCSVSDKKQFAEAITLGIGENITLTGRLKSASEHDVALDDCTIVARNKV
jgi:hypothetical protein